jgi:hypothetical protein
MKRIFVACLVLVLSAQCVLAGGDKNRGSKGKGKVHQVVGP